MSEAGARLYIAGLTLGAGLGLFGCQPGPEPPPPAPSEPRNDYEAPIGPEPLAFEQYHVGEVRNGDAVSTAFARAGVSIAESDELVAALKEVFDVRYARPGHWFELERDASGKLIWFQYNADATRTLIAYRDAEGVLRGMKEPVTVRTATTTVEGRVDGSLYAAMEAEGETPWLTLTLVDIFSWDIDFFTEPQSGDHFTIVVEKRYVGDHFIGYGNVLGAEYAFASGNRRHRAFRYTLAEGKTGYYTEEGKAVEKAFTKSPIQFASITSRYGLRKHPILQFVRAHKGVDYGAPMGTAVWSVGDGVVSFVGNQGGYGHVIYVRHKNGLETRYAHLREYAKGMRNGLRVSQKQVIGYVGKSGLATGPHLHFEVLRNGQHTNPLTVAAPPAPPIPAEELSRFHELTAERRAQLDAQGSLASGPRP